MAVTEKQQKIAKAENIMQSETLLAAAFVAALTGGAVTSQPSGKQAGLAQNPVDVRAPAWMIDSDSDGVINNAELAGYLYQVIDRDHDALITQDEWQTYQSGWLQADQIVIKTHDFWDLNEDGDLTQEEFAFFIDKTALWTMWDENKNNRLERNEFSSASFALYNDNDGDT